MSKALPKHIGELERLGGLVDEAIVIFQRHKKYWDSVVQWANDFKEGFKYAPPWDTYRFDLDIERFHNSDRLEDVLDYLSNEERTVYCESLRFLASREMELEKLRHEVRDTDKTREVAQYLVQQNPNLEDGDNKLSGWLASLVVNFEKREECLSLVNAASLAEKVLKSLESRVVAKLEHIAASNANDSSVRKTIICVDLQTSQVRIEGYPDSYHVEPHLAEMLNALVEAKIDGELYVKGWQMEELPGCKRKNVSREITKRLIPKVPPLESIIQSDKHQGYWLNK